jgi:hypothetical protein
MSKPITSLRKKAKLGDQGYPRATLAFYGPDDKKATKAVLGILLRDDDEPTLYRYFSEEKDVRFKIDAKRTFSLACESMRCVRLSCARNSSDVPTKKALTILKAPRCPFWKGRDRFA